MFDNFQQFNEAAGQPKKPASFHVGDLVKTTEFYYGSNRRGETFYASYGGAILEIESVAVKSGKWYYECKIVNGLLMKNEKRSASTPTKNSNWYKIVGFDKDFTKEGVDEFLKIAQEAKFQSGDEVDIPEKTRLVKLKSEENVPNKSVIKHTSNKIFSLSVDYTLQEGEPCYYIDKLGIIKESDINLKQSLSPEAIEALAKEIAKELKTETKLDSNKFQFGYQEFTIKMESNYSSLITGGFNINRENSLKFQEDMKKLINKYATPESQKAFGKAVKFEAKLSDDRYDASINQEEIVNAARNLKIDIDQVLHDKRGKINMRKFGV
jgi:hypothetical protein